MKYLRHYSLSLYLLHNYNEMNKRWKEFEYTDKQSLIHLNKCNNHSDWTLSIMNEWNNNNNNKQ